VVSGIDWAEAAMKAVVSGIDWAEAEAQGTGAVLVELLAMGVVEDASAHLPPVAALCPSCRCTRR
jgi:hypothetical protein